MFLRMTLWTCHPELQFFYLSSWTAVFYLLSWAATRWRIHIQTGTMLITWLLNHGFFVAQLLRMTLPPFCSSHSSLLLLFASPFPPLPPRTPLIAPIFATMFSPPPQHLTIHIRRSPQTLPQYSPPHHLTFPLLPPNQTITIFWLQNKNNHLI